MEEGMKIIITVLVLLIIGFGVVFILSDRVLNLNDDAKQREENSASGFRGLKCKMTGREYYGVSFTCKHMCDSIGKTYHNDLTDCSLPPISSGDCCCGTDLIDAVVLSIIPTVAECNFGCSGGTAVSTTNCDGTPECCCKCG